MNNYKFLREYLDLQKGIVFDELLDLPFATVGYNKNDSAVNLNFTLTDKVLSETELAKLEEKFKEINRVPAVYFENRIDLVALGGFLNKHGYKKTNEDSWMFYEDTVLYRASFESLKQVENEKDLKIFLQTFRDSYRDEKEAKLPLGLDDYLKLLQKVWKEHPASDRIEFFLAFRGDEPVAVATLTNYGGIGYISNVGSMPRVRGEGYGRTVTLYCVYKSMEHKNTFHCLVTEEGTHPHDFYSQLGLRTHFLAPLYVKS